eukprot:13344617-Ditylum_brightwellii.AAC.1
MYSKYNSPSNTTTSSSSSKRPNQVSMLWTSSPQQPKVVSVLVQPTMSTPVSSVYGWGHDCAKYHNAAVTSTGEVYTWGLYSGPLGVTSTTATDMESSHS